MLKDYYQNILYPLQDRILRMMESLPVDFYLTGGTALGRAYLHHRYSDDLDFFVNNSETFREQVQMILEFFGNHFPMLEVPVADNNFARCFIQDGEVTLKIDFVNDVAFRSGTVQKTALFIRTDNLNNILSNKISALPRREPKDVVDIVYIAAKFEFDWTDIMTDAAKKDIWVNPIETAKILDEFSPDRLSEIHWMDSPPLTDWFLEQSAKIIKGILEGGRNQPT